MSQPATKKQLPVPTLPLFMIETKRPEMSDNPHAGSTLKTLCQSDLPVSPSTLNFERPVKPERRKTKPEKSLELIASVHGTSKEHRSHKSRKKHKTFKNDSHDGNAHGESLSEELESVVNLTDEIPNAMQQFPKEFERLVLENRDLSRRIHLYEGRIEDSGFQNTTGTSTPTETLIGKEDVKRLLENLTEFENEYRALEKEKNHYKKLAQSNQNKAASTSPAQAAKINSLQLQNKELNEDILMLKNVVYRLNVELEAYQERLRKLGGDTSKVSNEHLDMPEGGIQVDRCTLAPLLEAYDQMIKEKEEIIDNYENDITNFVGQCKDVVAENERLHQEIEETNKKSQETTEGLSALHQDASMTLEQNDLLNCQLKEQKQKLKEIHTVYRDKLAELSAKNEELEDNYHRSRSELMTLKGSYSVLRDEHEKLKHDSENKVPFSVHSASVSECRRLFDELKRKYDVEQSYMTSKVDELIEEKPKMEAELMMLRGENGQLEMQVATIQKMLHKTQAKCDETQNRWLTTKVAKDAVKRQLQKAIAFSSELIADQEKLLQQLHSKQVETDTMAKLGSTLVNRMGSLKSKLKGVQQEAWQELDTIEKRITKQATGVGKMKDEYRRETQRLQNLVKQKEEIILNLQREKSKTEEDLEVVWKAATTDNINFGETIRRNLEREDSPSDDRF